MKIFLLHSFYIILFAFFVFGFPYLPLQDYPALIYQGFVFNEYIFHGYTFGGFWSLHHYFPPNAISTVILGLMDLFGDPLVTGKIYLFFLAIILYSGIVRYLAFHLQTRRT